MEFDLVQQEHEGENLQKRLIELERQLAEAQTTIRALRAGQGTNGHPKPTVPGAELLPLKEDSLRQALLVAPYPLMIWREDGKILLINAAFTEITGYRLEEIPNIERWSQKAFGHAQHPSLVIQGEDQQMDIKKWREFEVTTRSGELRIWDFSNALLGKDQDGYRLTITMAVDITERRQIEEQMQENEQKFFIIFEKAPFAAALSRLPDGILTDVNEAFEHSFGYTRREVVGRTSLELGIHPDPEARSRITAELQAHGTTRNVESQLYTKSGEARTYLLNIDMVTIGGKKYALQTAQDITERKRADEALNEITRLLELDRARLNTVLEHLPVGVWLTDAEGRIIGKNKQADRIWAGDSPFLDTVEEYGQYQSWHPDTGIAWTPEDYPVVIALRTGRPVEPVEAKIRRFDGTEGTILVSAAPIKDEQGTVTGVVAVNLDITDRKQAEEQLRKSEERFSKAFHMSPFGMNITRMEDGVILDTNNAWLKLLGWTREEVIGKTTAAFPFYVRPEDRAIVRERIKKEETTRGLEINIVRKDGTKLVVNVATTLIDLQGERCILGVLDDITQRKQAEEALKESEQRYRGLFERMQEGLVAGEVLTDEDGKPINYRYLDVNPATERQFGIPREQFIGHTYTEVLPEGDHEWIDVLGRVALTGEPVSVERFGRASGRWFEAHAYSPRPGQFVNILTDITERKKAEEALRESEERFAKAFHSSPDAIIISRLSDGLIIEVNEGWKELFGHDTSEVIGHTSIELNLFANPEDRNEAVRRILEQGSVRNFELGIRHKTGEIRLASLSAEKMEVNGEAALLTVLRDITEHKTVEKALQASEAKMRAVFRALTEGVVFLNRNGEVEEANDAVQLTYNHTLEELVDPELDPRFRIIRPDGTPLPVEEQPAMVALRTGKTVRDFEIGVPSLDGKISWRLVNAQPVLDDHGTLLGVVASFFDITERKQAEQALRESENRFRSLADSMPQLVWTALPDGRVDYYNERYKEYQDIKLRAGEDWDWAPVLHPDDTQATVDAWLHSVETGEIYQIEHRVRMANGSYRWHLSRGVPMLDEKERIARWFGTATDIHDLKLAEEQTRIYANRLEQSNRELEQFAFMASHDLQEPLRKIEMFGDLLLERAPVLNERERGYLDRMRNAAGRMRDMIEGLLRLSRVATQGKPFVQVDLAQVAAEALSDLEDLIQRTGGRVDVGILPTVVGDPSQLRQLMQNLIGNALKYHQPGKPPRIWIFASSYGDKVQIHVEDKGIGFDQADADRIFEPFQRLVGRSQYQGSGIGLAICRRIVDRHGGEIAAISELGHGTTFIVTLPVHLPNDTNDKTEKDASHEEPGTTPGRRG